VVEEGSEERNGEEGLGDLETGRLGEWLKKEVKKETVK
jgi:hypothetical protein